MPGQLVIVSPANTIAIVIIEKGGPSLEQLQTAVGGYIELVKVRYQGRIREAYVNEEGLLKGMPINQKASGWYQDAHTGETCNPLVGNIAIWVPTPKG